MSLNDLWHIDSVSSEKYHNVVDTKTRCVYNTASYNMLNEHKADKVWYLIVYKGYSPRFAVILGEKNGVLHCPYSAPFAYPEAIKNGMGIEDYYIAYELAEEFFINRGIYGVEIYMPPAFYDSDTVTAWINVFTEKKYRIKCCDINHVFFDIDEMITSYDSYISSSARNKLKSANSFNTEFVFCRSENECKIAYDIILENRRIKNRPIHMSFDQLMKTLPIVKGDVFLAKNGNDFIASAVVYRITDRIAQIVFWADRQGFNEMKPTNFISYQLIRYYSSKDYKHLDVGISTENGRPNYGLCGFKESIGCRRTEKIKLFKGRMINEN